MIGGGGGYYVVDELVMRRPQWVDEAMARERVSRAAEKVAKSEKVAKGVREEKRAGGARGIHWIAEPKHGPYRRSAFRVAGVRQDGSVETQAIDSRTARRGLQAAFARSLRKRGKAPKEDRDAQLRWYEGGGSIHGADGWAENKKEDGPRILPGDVFLSGIPMVDQGRAAFCAVASAARVLQGYGIEITMEDMAVLANSSEIGGTNVTQWDQALRQVAGEHGLELMTVKEVTDTANSLPSLVEEYNAYADDMGYDLLNASDYVMSFGICSILNYNDFSSDREYPVQREVMLSDDARAGAFNDNVIGRINDSDPLFWCVMLGDVPEEVPHSDAKVRSNGRGEHMRLIIGYNEDRGEVLYSDSWGEGHELKRMDGLDALSITTGMYYLTDKPQQ